jgi:cytochrome c-type biogenesis protein CcmE
MSTSAPLRSGMTRRRRRAVLIAVSTGILSLAVLLVLLGLRDSVVFFHTPSEAIAKHVPAGKRIRLGGLVTAGSLRHAGATSVTFAITDQSATIPVSYTGILPDLFREGQGVVAEGRLDAAGRFLADTVLAKHDENYMPPEVAKALKKKGVWKGEGARAQGAN